LTYRDFKEALQKAFRDTSIQDRADLELKNIVQGKNQPIVEYITYARAKQLDAELNAKDLWAALYVGANKKVVEYLVKNTTFRERRPPTTVEECFNQMLAAGQEVEQEELHELHREGKQEIKKKVNALRKGKGDDTVSSSCKNNRC
jgi:hypothetical protein